MKKLLAVIALFLWFQPAWAGELSQAISAYRARNYEAAVAIIRPLAERGDPYAEFTLGAMYDNGIGVPRNFTLALSWYKRAGQQGLADAQYMAGRFYGGGRGVKQDIAKALFWLELAAAGGHPMAPLLRDQHYNQLKDRGAPARDGGRHRLAVPASHPAPLQHHALHLSELDAAARLDALRPAVLLSGLHPAAVQPRLLLAGVTGS